MAKIATKSDRPRIDKELEKIAKENKGVLRPGDVVEYSKDPDTALHNHFEWDDTKAGHQFRLVQARRIIRAYMIVIENDHEVTVRAFVSLQRDRGKDSYRSIKKVLADEVLRTELLEEALEELRSLKMKYQILSELASVFEVIDKVT